MIDKVRIEGPRFLPGATARLAQRTALVRLHLSGDAIAWRERFRPRDSDLMMILPGQQGRWQQAGADDFGEWVAALTVAIQREAGDAAWRGRALGRQGNVVALALPYERDAVLKNALQWALGWLLLWGKPAATATERSDLVDGYRSWLEKAQAGGLAPNTLRFALAAYARGWPVRVDGPVLHIGWGAHSQQLDSSFTGQTGVLATRTARDKHLTSRLLHEAALPVAPTGRVPNWEAALDMAHRLGWPVVIKPSNQDQGIGVVPGIRDEAALRAAFDEAARYSPGAVIVEKHIAGEDHRLLVVQGKLLVATLRTPGGVVGDGVRSVAQLVDAVNADPRRGTGKCNLLIRLALDAEALACLAEQQLSAEGVPAAGQIVRLRRTANISTGGTAEDVTARIHPDNRRLAERAARIIGLDIAGIDFLCPDITRSWREVGGAICEVNAQPGFRPHWLGDPARDINGEILDLLFAGRSPRIPTAAITGTNGKTIVSRMLHRIWQAAGKVAGVCTTQGVWIGDELISGKNLSGLPGARIVLGDPTVEAAVLELPCKGLIRFGHPCDRYDVAALLNVQDDHLGVDGIETLDQMAKLKAEVLERASQTVVVNADDPRCLAMRARAGCAKHILVAGETDNPAVARHRAEGGAAAFVGLRQDERWIVLAEGTHESALMPLREIPATMDGLLRFNESNALFAVALAWAQNLSPKTIRQAMADFRNTPEQTQG